jgi:hypothetical protein
LNSELRYGQRYQWQRGHDSSLPGEPLTKVDAKPLPPHEASRILGS